MIHLPDTSWQSVAVKDQGLLSGKHPVPRGPEIIQKYPKPLSHKKKTTS